MAIKLSKAVESAILAQVGSGKFNDAEQVVAEGLRLIEERERERLQILVEAGWQESEQGLTFSPEEARIELDRRRAMRLEQRKAS